MDQIRIQGGTALQGELAVSGAKNAALPLMAAALLTDATLTLSNLPHLMDISSMANLLGQHGVALHLNGHGSNGSAGGRVLELSAKRITSTVAPYDLVRKMRASVLVLGPLLGREGEARVSLPGGCAIGTRPVDIHLAALEALGAKIQLEDGYIAATAPKGLVGNRVVFPKVSVGATENLLMAAVLAKGDTELVNAAREPEITDLANCLNAMGAKIEGIGTNTLQITGVSNLHDATHQVIADRIETGTYAMAAAATNGDVELLGAVMDHNEAMFETLRKAGVEATQTERGIRVRRANGALNGTDVMTEPFPGFPTDLQAQIMSMMTVADGASMITETIFENRFMHVPELLRMGADINIHHASAMVRGTKSLKGAPVMATDLRASVSLVIAGLCAEGETVIRRVYHLDRGYERLE